jgi:hypothetical protein
LLIRSDRSDGTVSGIINSPDITGSDWRYVTASLPVSNDTFSLTFGVRNYPGATVLVDDGSFEGSEVSPFEAPRPLTASGVQNLAAFARVFGYVRHFHPSDQVEQTDWDSFAAYGVRTVESAETPGDLASRLQTLFDPIAPNIRIFPEGTRPDPAPSSGRPPPRACGCSGGTIWASASATRTPSEAVGWRPRSRSNRMKRRSAAVSPFPCR